MSTIAGAGAVVLGLIAEEVLVTSKGGPAAISGAAGALARAIDRLGDPTIALVPNLADRKAAAPVVRVGPMTAPPPGGTGPPRDYASPTPPAGAPIA